MINRRSILSATPIAVISVKACALDALAPLPRVSFDVGETSILPRIWRAWERFVESETSPLRERDAIREMRTIVRREAECDPPFILHHDRDGLEPLIFHGIAYSPEFLVVDRFGQTHDRLPTFHLEWTEAGRRWVYPECYDKPEIRRITRHEYMHVGSAAFFTGRRELILEDTPCL